MSSALLATALRSEAGAIWIALGFGALLALLIWRLVKDRGRRLVSFAPTLAGRVTGARLVGVLDGIPFSMWLPSARVAVIQLAGTPRLQRQIAVRRPDSLERWWWRRFGKFAGWPAAADGQLLIQMVPRREAFRLLQVPAVRTALVAIVEDHRAGVCANSQGLRLVVRSSGKAPLEAGRLAEAIHVGAALPALFIEHGAPACTPLSPSERRRLWAKLAWLLPITLVPFFAFMVQIRQLRSADALLLMGLATGAVLVLMGIGELIIRWGARTPPESRRRVRSDVRLASMAVAALLGAGACYANRAWDTSPIRHTHWRVLSVEGRNVLLASVADSSVTMRLRLDAALISQLADHGSTIEIISRKGAFGWSYADIIGVDPSQ